MLNYIRGWPGKGLPLAGAVGVALNGVPIYPAIDAGNEYVWTMCEASKCNAHGIKFT